MVLSRNVLQDSGWFGLSLTSALCWTLSYDVHWWKLGEMFAFRKISHYPSNIINPGGFQTIIIWTEPGSVESRIGADWFCAWIFSWCELSFIFIHVDMVFVCIHCCIIRNCNHGVVTSLNQPMVELSLFCERHSLINIYI